MRKVSTYLLLFLSALQGLSPDTSDLASNTVLSIVLQTDVADFPLDNDEMPDDVCGPNGARRVSINLPSLAALHLAATFQEHPLACLDDRSRQRLNSLKNWIRTGRDHELCRLTC